LVAVLISTTGEPASEQATVKEMKHMSTGSPRVQQGKPNKCNNPHYEHRKCNEYNHLQMARCVSYEDNATVSINMLSVHILINGVSKSNIKVMQSK